MITAVSAAAAMTVVRNDEVGMLLSPAAGLPAVRTVVVVKELLAAVVKELLAAVVGMEVVAVVDDEYVAVLRAAVGAETSVIVTSSFYQHIHSTVIVVIIVVVVNNNCCNCNCN